MRSAGLLASVSHITAVSGGSITAAHLGVHWDRYSESPEQFKEVADELIAFTQLGVREHVVTWLPVIITVGRRLPLPGGSARQRFFAIYTLAISSFR